MLECINRDVYVRIQSDLLVIGDSIITDRHHASGDQYEPDNPQNKIGGIIPSFSLSGWLRHGIERAVQAAGGTVCHPGDPDARYKRKSVYERDLDAGYHEKGACTDDPSTEAGCLVFDLFGGFNQRPGKLMRRPIKFSPVREVLEYHRGQAEGHYRRLTRNVVARNSMDAHTTLRHTSLDAVGNLDGCWHLRFRQLKPEYVGALIEAIEYLDRNQTAFNHQLGGARNFGGGIVDCHLINPLYTKAELRTENKRTVNSTATMETKDTYWEEDYRPVFLEAFHQRVSEDADDEPAE